MTWGTSLYIVFATIPLSVALAYAAPSASERRSYLFLCIFYFLISLAIFVLICLSRKIGLELSQLLLLFIQAVTLAKAVIKNRRNMDRLLEDKKLVKHL